VIVYLFTQIFIIGHKGTIFFPKQKFCFRVHFCFSCKNVASKSFYKSKIHPFPLMLMQRNEMWYTYTPLGIYLITQYPCRSVVNCSSEMVVKDARHLLCFVIPLPCFAGYPCLLSHVLLSIPHSPTNFIFWLGRLIFSVSINSTGTCFIQKIYAPSSSLLQGKHLPFSPSPLRLNIFRLFVILSLTQLYRYMDRSVTKIILYGPQKLRSI
jgi:hypothetical protein